MDRMAEMKARIAEKLASMGSISKPTPPPTPEIKEAVAVIEPPAIDTPVITEDNNVIAPLTEDSSLVQELADDEPADDKYIIIGGSVFSRDNPFIIKMMEVWEKDELAKTGSIEKLNVSERLALCEPHELAQLLFNRDLAKEFGVTDLGMYVEVYNIEVTKVKNMTLSEIDERIKKFRQSIQQMETLIMASTAVRLEKSRREKAELRKGDDATYKQDNAAKIKAKLANRTSTIRKPSVSSEEKLILNIMKSMNVSREKAVAFLKED